jgi:O-antigen ligase
MGIDFQLNQLLTFASSPVGAVLLFFYIEIFLAIGTSRRVKWVVLCLLMYIASLGRYDKPWVDYTLIQPLQSLLNYSREITTALLVTLLVPTFLANKGNRKKLLLTCTAAFFVMELVYAGRLWTGGFPERGLLSLCTYSLVFGTLGIGLSKWLQGIEDVRMVLKALVGVGILFLIGVTAQLLANRSAIVWESRLFGTTGSPQHTALVIAMLIPVVCYFLMLSGKSQLWKGLLAVIAGVFSIFLIWTGSRTGVLMSLIGVVLLFRTRFGKLALILGFSGVFALLAWNLFSESTENIGRLASREDTRTWVWNSLIQDFKSSPWLGYIPDDGRIGENSYLSVAARLGVMGLLPLMIGFVLCGVSLIKLMVKKRYLNRDESLLSDLVLSSFVVIAVGAFFEGYLLGTLTFMVFYIYALLAILTYLLDREKVFLVT